MVTVTERPDHAADDPLTRAAWYTHVRRIPIVLGKGPDGRPLPGGPYTVKQFIAGAVTFGLLARTARWWAESLDVVSTAVIVAAVSLSVLFLAGKLPRTTVNPALTVVGLCTALVAPRSGKVNGAVIRIARPHRAGTATVRVLTPTGATDGATATVATRARRGDPHVEPSAGQPVRTSPARPLSNVQLALAYGTRPTGTDH